MSIHDANKKALAALRDVLSEPGCPGLQAALAESFAEDAEIRLCAPFQEVAGPADLWARVYAPLCAAMPDLERRDWIFMAGPRWGEGKAGDWVGIGGNIVGTLDARWLGIPATGKPVFMRYHEYLRLEGCKVVEMEGLWDIPQVMLQAGVWPMAPQNGVEWMCPGPVGGGLLDAPWEPGPSSASVQLVWDMLHDLQKGDAKTPERGLGGYWHDHALWYGSTGIGTGRGHKGIVDTVLRGFREGLSNNTRHLEEGVFFGDHHLVAFTGWPSGTATHSGDGFLGLAPTGKRVSRRSLDFWRIQDGRIRENWVMVDLIDLYRQLGVDIFGRMEARLA